MDGLSTTWGHDRLAVTFGWTADSPVRLVSATDAAADRPDTGRTTAGPQPSAQTDPRRGQPLVEILLAGAGRRRATSRLSETVIGARLRHRSHRLLEDQPGWTGIEFVQEDAESALTVTTVLRAPLGVAAFRAEVTVSNAGGADVLLQGIAVASRLGDADPVDDLDVVLGRSDWLAEGRWERSPLRDSILIDLDLPAQPTDPKGALRVSSGGSWSTGSALPAGVLVNRRTDRAWSWQVETNGAWRWEIGERRDGAYLALSGPTDTDHQWSRRLEPAENFTSVPVAIALSSDGGLDGALAELTGYRRAARRPHDDTETLPVVFNDFMNTLMGDPTTQKLLPLIDAAASVGAEIFVIDAGWYDDGGDWWDSVGEWLPSTTRFPGGLAEMIDRIRAAGMRPGLWLEPEVIGVRSPMADRLPAEAFLQRGGVRVREHNRYHLDLRHPAARAHLDSVVDRVVRDYGAEYLKLDYNIDAGPGTDLDADSAGDGLLRHNRAHLDWLDGVLDRHPRLVLENCASGAMRMDSAMLSRLQLQSTSDQQSPALYPPIAASAPAAMPPEQAASWAYPQPGMTDEEAAFTLVTAMLGRFYLSGHLDRMTEAERALVADAVATHRDLRRELRTKAPFWPVGLPAWSAPWVALGLADDESALLSVWRRGASAGPLELPLPRYAGRQVEVEVVFPRALEPWRFVWDAGTAVLTVTPGTAPLAARTVRILPR